MGEQPVSGAVRTHAILTKFVLYMGVVHGAQNNYHSNIKDQWSQTNIANIIIMKKLKYCKNYQNVIQRHEENKYCWKNGANRLARHKVATNLLFIKNMKYLQSAIKQSAIRPGVPTQGHFMETKQLPMGRDGDRRPPPGSLSPVLFPHGLSPLFFSAYLLRFLASLGLLSFSVFSLVCM